jgi:hypothetical protein
VLFMDDKGLKGEEENIHTMGSRMMVLLMVIHLVKMNSEKTEKKYIPLLPCT